MAPLADGSSARGAVCPGGPAGPRAWQDLLLALLLPAALQGERC